MVKQIMVLAVVVVLEVQVESVVHEQVVVLDKVELVVQVYRQILQELM